MKDTINKVYGNKVRVRACGVCTEGDAILLVNHKGLGDGDNFWAPPGGGVEFGETVEQTIVREFKEETGLLVAVKKFLFVNELLHENLQGIELFFEVKKVGGELMTGTDPEHEKSQQIIKQVKFVTFNELAFMNKNAMHNVLHGVVDKKTLLKMSGYFKFIR